MIKRDADIHFRGVRLLHICDFSCCYPEKIDCNKLSYCKKWEKSRDTMRQPVNVHVYLYRKNQEGEWEYAVFQRTDDTKCWQGVSGGVEEGETIQQAALRETFEEAGVAADAPLYRLDTVSSLPADIFAAHDEWGNDVLICPMYFFAMPFEGEITLSDEHLDMRWCLYQNAYDLVYWHDQKTALWELNQRLLHGNLVR
ncbi:MAG: NUDIX domain-containing protein [Eubacteriales bacterium]|nr:NUDIX domain-containing protein [Eubacteriales bacterium]